MNDFMSKESLLSEKLPVEGRRGVEQEGRVNEMASNPGIAVVDYLHYEP